MLDQNKFYGLGDDTHVVAEIYGRVVRTVETRA
jgi:hypothetical protein